ncbi:MAG: hypothetical protein IT372_09370 [Polyangiaceae bacterium]|nr:hypothetical protein [Polyangiaceae bacterium]
MTSFLMHASLRELGHQHDRRTLRRGGQGGARITPRRAADPHSHLPGPR